MLSSSCLRLACPWCCAKWMDGVGVGPVLCPCCVEVSCCLYWVWVGDWGWVAASWPAAAKERARQPAQNPAQELSRRSSCSLTLRYTLDLAGYSRQRCRGQAVDFQLAQQAGTPGSVPAWQHHYAATSSSQQGVGWVAVLAVVVCGPPVGVCLEPAFTCHLPAVCLLGRASC